MPMPLVLLALLLAAAPAGAATVRDAVGRTVAVPAEPRRIVSLAPNITELLFARGLGEGVAGVTQYCDWPPEAAAKPRIGGVINPSLEAITARYMKIQFREEYIHNAYRVFDE